MHNACIQVATYERKLTQANRIMHMLTHILKHTSAHFLTHAHAHTQTTYLSDTFKTHAYIHAHHFVKVIE